MAAGLHLKATFRSNCLYRVTLDPKTRRALLFPKWAGCKQTNLVKNTHCMVHCTYFLDVFLRRVRGETAAALMTLVLEDIRRNFRTAPPNSSFSSILYDAAFYSGSQRSSVRSNNQKQTLRGRKTDTVYTKKAEDRWQLLTHHGGSLNTAENWKGPIRARLRARLPLLRHHDVGGVGETNMFPFFSIHFQPLRYRTDRITFTE